MTAYEVQRPIYKVFCDEPECQAEFTPEPGFWRRAANLARAEARRAGWDVPPAGGKGSRSTEDYCPVHHRRTA